MLKNQKKKKKELRYDVYLHEYDAYYNKVFTT